MKPTVFVIGLGLIGSSLCANLKQKNHVIGWDTSPQTCQVALASDLVNEIAPELACARRADFILLAVPVKATLHYLEKLASLQLKGSVIVSDTGSTKNTIMEAAANYPFTFIGGHPMAGSHKSGVRAVNPDLFEEAYYILTPQASAELASIKKLQVLLQVTRAKFVTLPAPEHDRIVAVLSHLPHIVASGLANQAQQLATHYPGSEKLAAGGFRDLTRIASADPQMWTDILVTNQAELLPLLKNWQHQMAQVIQWLEEQAEPQIFQYFTRAKAQRDHLPQRTAGSLPAFYDLLVDIPDHPGTIATVTQLISQAGISLINLQIQETREDIWGILELTFTTQADRSKAKRAIEQQTDFACHLREEAI